MLSEAERKNAVEILLKAEKEKKPALQLSKTYPGITIEDAYAIQSLVNEAKVKAGSKVIGNKIGLTSKAMQQSSQIDEPDYGVLHDYMVIEDGAKIPFERFIVPRVEIELVFVLGKALKGPGVGLLDVLRATEYVVPAIEIIDARVQNPRKIFDTVADNGAAAGLVIGGRAVGPMDIDLRWVSGLLYRNADIEETGVAAQEMPLDIVHQDAALLVINKAPGVVVHPGAGNREHTLQNALLALDPKLKRVPRAGLVHRIDKDTSGLLVVARTLEAQTALVNLLAAHEIEREYLALCTGLMTGGGTVDEPIGRHRTQRIKMAVRRDGRAAVTHYRIEKKYRAHTLARVRLETGRTHQIRVHLAHVGYPIVGDPVYGGRRRLPAGATPALKAALEGFRRQALHAERLSFTHPRSGEPVSYHAPLPADLRELLGELERDLAEAEA